MKFLMHEQENRSKSHTKSNFFNGRRGSLNVLVKLRIRVGDTRSPTSLLDIFGSEMSGFVLYMYSTCIAETVRLV